MHVDVCMRSTSHRSSTRPSTACSSSPAAWTRTRRTAAATSARTTARCRRDACNTSSVTKRPSGAVVSVGSDRVYVVPIVGAAVARSRASGDGALSPRCTTAPASRTTASGTPSALSIPCWPSPTRCSWARSWKAESPPLSLRPASFSRVLHDARIYPSGRLTHRQTCTFSLSLYIYIYIYTYTCTHTRAHTHTHTHWCSYFRLSIPREAGSTPTEPAAGCPNGRAPATGTAWWARSPTSSSPTPSSRTSPASTTPSPGKR